MFTAVQDLALVLGVKPAIVPAHALDLDAHD
jgi:hypothetical protein